MKNINDLSISNTGRVTVSENSADAAFVDPSYLKTVKGPAKLKIGGNIELSLSGDGTSDGVEDPSFDNKAPTLEDISVVSKGIYLNDKGEYRAKLTIKVRNSSGSKIKGVDAVISIPQSSGGK